MYCVHQVFGMSSVAESSYQICLEGNIGAGKSTLLEYFSTQPGVDVLPETLQLWRNLPLPGTSEKHNLLESFYQDPSKHTFAFQSYVMLTKVAQHLAPSPKPVKLLERGLHSMFNIFSQALQIEGHFPLLEFAVHSQWHEHFYTQHPEMMPDLILWLRTSPVVNYERVQLRARAEEKAISLEYLTLLSDLHEKWLSASPFAERTVVINGDGSKADVLQACKAAMESAIPAKIKALMAAPKDN